MGAAPPRGAPQAMQYFSQLCIILGFAFMGELLQRFIPLPVPASIYGLVLLFGALWMGLVKLEQVREVGSFLTSLLPVLFVSPVVGILEHWHVIAPALVPICLLIAASTVLTFGVSGRIAQRLLRGKDGVGRD